MARSPLTLAALATSAVADLDVVAVRAAGASAGGRFDSAVLATYSTGDLIIRVPATPAAELEQSGDLVSLQALTQGARSRLPFGVPRVLGQAPFETTRGVVYEYFPGETGSQALIESDRELALATGEAIAAIHSLPTSVVTDAGLPVATSADIAREAKSLRDRAASTKLVPSGLLARWSSALDDSALWQFAPTVIHGRLGPECFILTPPEVAAVIDWAGFGIGDPAADLFWVSSFHDGAVASALFDRYEWSRNGSTDHQLKKRARLYAELEIAKWLLHGVDSRDKSVVDDAVLMLQGLEDSTASDLLNPLSTDTGQVLDVVQVEDLLDRTPRTASIAHGYRSATGGISED